MICTTTTTTKEDVVLWFKELESYKRIDTMCTLLNMCLPFELRFLGTCLEELGRRDSQELRGIELRVNNAAELAADVASCRQGEPTDLKIRRKMALYLALIRSCSRSCVVELFHTLDGWGDRDFLHFGENSTDEATPSAASDPLQELLLVYTMAANHPVFSFEQRMKCGQIYTKISDCNQRLLTGGGLAISQDLTAAGRPSSTVSSCGSMTNLETPPPQPLMQMTARQECGGETSSMIPTGHAGHVIHAPVGLSQMQQQQQQQQQMSIVQEQQHQMQHGMITHIPMGYAANAPGAQIITTTSDPNAMTIEGLTQIMPISLSLQPEFIGNTTTATNRMQQPPSWPIRHGLMHASYPPPSIEPMSLPAIPASMSPLSEPSSPVQSRTASPSRQHQPMHMSQQPPHSQQQLQQQQQQQHHQHQQQQQQPQHHQQHQQPQQQSHHSQHSLQMQHRSNAAQQQQQHNQRSSPNVLPNRRPSDDRTSPPQQQQQHVMMGSEAPNTKIYDETVLNVDGALTQLQSIHRNGYTRSSMHHTLPRLNKHNTYLQQQHHHFHMQQQQQQQQHHHQQLQHHQQQQQHLHQQHATSQYTTGNSVHGGYAAQPNKSQQHQLVDGNSHFMEHGTTEMRHKSAESDSSSVSDSSPPETPTLLAGQHPHHLHSQSTNASSRVQFGTKHFPRHNGGRSSSSSTATPNVIAVPADKVLYVNSGNSFNLDQPQQSSAVILPPLSTAPPQLISTASQVGSTTNPSIMHIHQFPPPNTGHTLNASYPTQYGQPPHMVTGRGAILSQPPPSQSQQQLYRSTHPPTYAMQQTSNGEIMYTSFPPQQQQQHTPPSLPYHLSAAANVTSIISPAVRLSPSIQQQVSSLPSTHPAASLLLDPALAAAAPSNPKQIQSCFNCGSQSHTGRECKEASMEDVTRNSIYKLDYSAAQALADLQSAAAAAAANAAGAASPLSATSSNTSSINTSTGSSGDGQDLIPEVVSIIPTATATAAASSVVGAPLSIGVGPGK